MMGHLIDGEVEMIQKYIPENAVVFDVGAFDGDWSAVVLQYHPNAHIHAFEPIPFLFDKLKQNMDEVIKKGLVRPNNFALSNHKGLSEFWVYEDHPAMSTLHRRDDAEMASVHVRPPISTKVSTTTLDAYCLDRGIRWIDFLKIDVEGNEWAVLDGARGLFERDEIQCVQFEYGRCLLDSHTTLKMIFDLLLPFGFKIGKVNSTEVVFQDTFKDEFERYDYCNYIAVK